MMLIAVPMLADPISSAVGELFLVGCMILEDSSPRKKHKRFFY